MVLKLRLERHGVEEKREASQLCDVHNTGLMGGFLASGCAFQLAN